MLGPPAGENCWKAAQCNNSHRSTPLQAGRPSPWTDPPGCRMSATATVWRGRAEIWVSNASLELSGVDELYCQRRDHGQRPNHRIVFPVPQIEFLRERSFGGYGG